MGRLQPELAEYAMGYTALLCGWFGPIARMPRTKPTATIGTAAAHLTITALAA